MKRLLQLAVKLPAIIDNGVNAVEKLKLPGANKKAVVLEMVYENKILDELDIGPEFLRDPEIKQAIESYLEAEAAALKFKDKLSQLIASRASRET